MRGSIGGKYSRAMTAPAAPAASFEEHFAREIVASERIRAGVLAALLAALMLAFTVIFALFRSTYQEYMSGPAAFRHAGAILAALLAYEVTIFRVIGGRM